MVYFTAYNLAFFVFVIHIFNPEFYISYLLIREEKIESEFIPV